MSRRQKAAVVVRLVLAQGGSLALSDMPEDIQTALTEEIARMRGVDAATLGAIAAEFSDQVEAVGLPVSGGLENALALLDGQLSPGVTSRLRRMIAAGSRADPWERISGLDVDRLLPILEAESTEIGAVMLSMLSAAMPMSTI